MKPPAARPPMPALSEMEREMLEALQDIWAHLYVNDSGDWALARDWESAKLTAAIERAAARAGSEG